MKVMRSLSIISAGSDVDEKAIQEVLLRRKSTKKIQPLSRQASRQASVKMDAKVSVLNCRKSEMITILRYTILRGVDTVI